MAGLCLLTVFLTSLKIDDSGDRTSVTPAVSLPGSMKVDIRVPLFYMRSPSPRPVGRVAIIIDDLGHDLAVFRKLGSLRAPLTMSVLPALPRSKEAALQAVQRGFQVMIHLPMEPIRYPNGTPRPDVVKVGMTREEVARFFDSALADVPGAMGLNNHMGSRATRSRALMREVLSQAKIYGLFFIDSRTTSKSVAYEAARELDVPAGFRGIFLDSERSPDLIRRQLRRLVAKARRDGAAIGIGHPFPETLTAIREAIPKMRAQGIVLVYASQLTHY